ncbi:hypothetical protein TeGR_g14536 [Tetraparma gracilis]|uniref:Uncharacterized protein n=1 Tax=Tetraparma gracilis TaxID=2962635 RepID=A0ABQ6N4P7_9STRA|nr:hypothetical protein TeGR_g14536 [Tetraparma gracilis]
MSLTDLSDIDLEETEDFATVSKILGSQGAVFGEELDAETAESLLDALLRMTSTAPKAELGGEAWGPVAACVAEFSPDEPQVVEVALGILAKVSGSCQDKLDEAFVTLLKRVMDENGDDEPTIQEHADPAAVLAYLKRKSFLERAPLRYAVYASVLVARKQEGRRVAERRRASPLAAAMARLPPDMNRVIVEFLHGVAQAPQ